MIPYWVFIVAIGAFFLLGYVTALPEAYRVRWWRKQLAYVRHQHWLEGVARYSDLSWKYVKENGAYLYTYLTPSKGRHSKSLKRRMAMWWAQTEPRYPEKVKVTVHAS